MYRKRFCFILLAVTILAGGCKKESSAFQGDTFVVDMPGTAEHSYVEFPLQDWGTTLPMDTYEVSLGEDEYFSFAKVRWADTLQKVQEQWATQGLEWNEDALYEAISANFFALMVNTGKADGSVEETLLDSRKAYRYAITALDDMQTGESVVKGEGKGHIIMIPTEMALYIMAYYASDTTYDQQREQEIFDSLKIDES